MEYVIIAALTLFSLWLGGKMLWLRRGIKELSQAISQSPPPLARDLPNSAIQTDLSRLTNTSIDILTEAMMTWQSENHRRRFLEALLNEIQDAIFIIDSSREIQFVNKSAQVLFPSDQPYENRSFMDVCRDHRIIDTLELADELGSKASDQIDLRIQEGERIREITLLVEAEPLSFQSGRFEGDSGSWILMRDVTTQLETEQIRRDFVANASHELRTPLSIINGYLETLDEGSFDLENPSTRRAVSTMRKHGERISRIVDDMLTISKLENAADLLKREPFDLLDSLNEMISQLMPLIEEQKAKITVSADPTKSWTLKGDRFYWDQIFFNLIENALKQNPRENLWIDVRFSELSHRFVISVVDDGIGIPAADIPLIFKRFYRVQKSHAQNQVKGTGLGLSIVKRAVEAHQGKISVESIPGEETAFTISVPQNATAVKSSGADSSKN
ncbi:MAG: ATP-binding protein [Verrucomicrobiota bacterium]